MIANIIVAKSSLEPNEPKSYPFSKVCLRLTTGTTFPENSPENDSQPEIRMVFSSHHSLSLSYARVNHEILSLFGIFFDGNQIERERKYTSITASIFFLTLFRVFISPNAP